MKRLVYSTVLLSTIYLAVSCKLPSDSISSLNQPANQIDNGTDVQAYLPSEARSIIQSNLVDKSLQTDYQVRQGIIHFKDLDTYLKVRDELRNLSIADRIKKTKIAGFVSLLSLYKEYADKNEKNEDTKSYQDIISSVVDNKKQEFLNTDFVVSALINRAGLVYIGNILYRFTDKSEEIVLDGDQSKLGTTHSLVQKIDHVVTPLTKQARSAIGDYCRQSWHDKVSIDGQRRIALDVKMKMSSYVTGTTTINANTGTHIISFYTSECQPTAFAVPYKNNGIEWKNYRTTNHLKSAWSFTVTQPNNHLVRAAYNNFEYWNDWNFIDYGGTILTFYNVPSGYLNNGYVYPNDLIPSFQFDGGYYYTDGVPFAQKLPMECF